MLTTAPSAMREGLFASVCPHIITRRVRALLHYRYFYDILLAFPFLHYGARMLDDKTNNGVYRPDALGGNGKSAAKKKLRRVTIGLAAFAFIAVLGGGGYVFFARSGGAPVRNVMVERLNQAGRTAVYERKYLIPSVSNGHGENGLTEGGGEFAPPWEAPRPRREPEGFRDDFVLNAEDQSILKEMGLNLAMPANMRFSLPVKPDGGYPEPSPGVEELPPLLRHDNPGRLVVYQDNGISPDYGELLLSYGKSGKVMTAVLNLANGKSGYICGGTASLNLEDGRLWELRGDAMFDCSGSLFRWFWQPFNRHSGFMVALEIRMGMEDGSRIYIVYGLEDEAAFPLIRNLACEWQSQAGLRADSPGFKFTGLPAGCLPGGQAVKPEQPVAGAAELSGLPQKFWSPRQFTGAVAIGYSQISDEEYGGTLARHGTHGPLTLSLEGKGEQCTGYLREVDALKGLYQGPLQCVGGQELLMQCAEDGPGLPGFAGSGSCVGGNTAKYGGRRFYLRYGTEPDEAMAFVRGR